MALSSEFAPNSAVWGAATRITYPEPKSLRAPCGLGSLRDGRTARPTSYVGWSIPCITSLALASVAAKGLVRRAVSSKGPPAFAREDLRYVYPLSDGVEAFSFKPATKRHTIDFLRSSYFLILHVIAFTWGPSTFSVPALLCCVSLFVSLQTLGISLSYHRHLTHRSFQCHKYFEPLGITVQIRPILVFPTNFRIVS